MLCVGLSNFNELSETTEVAPHSLCSCRHATGVHGRTRVQRHHTGAVRWEQIKAIVQAVQIPVIANGNVKSLADADLLLRRTGAAAAMAATGLLKNAHLFAGAQPDSFRDVWAYLEQARRSPPPGIRFVRDHVVGLIGKQWGPVFKHHQDVYNMVMRNASVSTVRQVWELMRVLATRLDLPAPTGIGADAGAEAEPRHPLPTYTLAQIKRADFELDTRDSGHRPQWSSGPSSSGGCVGHPGARRASSAAEGREDAHAGVSMDLFGMWEDS